MYRTLKYCRCSSGQNRQWCACCALDQPDTSVTLGCTCPNHNFAFPRRLGVNRIFTMSYSAGDRHVSESRLAPQSCASVPTAAWCPWKEYSSCTTGAIVSVTYAFHNCGWLRWRMCADAVKMDDAMCTTHCCQQFAFWRSSDSTYAAELYKYHRGSASRVHLATKLFTSSSELASVALT